MLRLAVALLVVANLLFFAWTQGKLDGVAGVRSQGDREPDRLNRQVSPGSITVVPTANASLMVAESAQPVCLEAGPYNASQIGPAEGVLQTILPAGSWVSVKAELPGAWIVYVGRYATAEALQKRVEELRRLRVPYEEVRSNPAEAADGLSLGRFDNRPAAERSLAELAQRGIRSARIMELQPPGEAHMLRIERADATLQNRLAGLRADSLLGKSFALCGMRP